MFLLLISDWRSIKLRNFLFSVDDEKFSCSPRIQRKKRVSSVLTTIAKARVPVEQNNQIFTRLFSNDESLRLTLSFYFLAASDENIPSVWIIFFAIIQPVMVVKIFLCPHSFMQTQFEIRFPLCWSTSSAVMASIFLCSRLWKSRFDDELNLSESYKPLWRTRLSETSSSNYHSWDTIRSCSSSEFKIKEGTQWCLEF